ncbi:unnamed protein product [Linum tenue]|uniref:F-box domain-containing protein n=1 Tax=Linum tenue TaxID=586396 RepID=A0AAV0Q3Y5_9ROSI|nr:unnamed protein product [Linum tenue]
MSIQNPNKKIRSEGKPDQQQTDAVDRLSSLPDHVLHHLLSFIVESRFSVQTSVLSRRWRPLWEHVPRLTLRANLSTIASTFARYVDALLSARPDGSNVDEINYCDLEFSGNTEPLHKFIQFAASRRCRELFVTAVTDLQPYFLAPLADNSNLTTLELRAARLGTGFDGFSSLRVLHLDEVSLPCSSAADLDLFVGFPIKLATARVRGGRRRHTKVGNAQKARDLLHFLFIPKPEMYSSRYKTEETENVKQKFKLQ